MKQISNALAAHIAGEVTTIATCWKLKRRDGATFGFTSHDSEIYIEGLAYKAASGFAPGSWGDFSTPVQDKLEVEAVLSAESISESDIMAGKYDFAEIEVFMVNYKDPAAGKLKLKRGWLGEVRLDRQQFIAEVRGLSQLLAKTIGELFSPSCRASFGDPRCKLNPAAYSISSSVSSSLGKQSFIDTNRTEAVGLYDFGKLTFTSGANSGIPIEVKEFVAGGKVTLVLPVPYEIGVGDCYTMVQGCDKTLAICNKRYNNVINFRGEPYVPGIDKMLETAGTRAV